MSAQWPSALVTTSQLYVAVNELQNNLSGAINNAVTTIGLNSTTGFATVGLVLIDNEVIQYTGISGNNLTGCTRAFDGTSAASHSSGATVSYAFCAAHYNNAANEIIAVESYLDTVLGKGTSVTATEFSYLHGVTSAIQTQLGTKAPTASPTFTGTIGTALTVSRALQTDGSGNLQVSAVTTTELGYVSGVTSAIQTQLNATIANPLTGDLAAGTHKITGIGNATAAQDVPSYNQIKLLSAPLMATSTTIKSTSSTSYVDTNVTQAITPSSSSSRIRITVSGVLANNNVTGTGITYLTVARGGTDLSGGNGFAAIETRTNGEVPVSFVYIDSPAATTATTYAVRIKVGNASDGGSFGDTNVTQVLIVEEIR